MGNPAQRKGTWYQERERRKDKKKKQKERKKEIGVRKGREKDVGNCENGEILGEGV